MGFGSWFKGSEPVTIEPVGTRSALENHLDTLLAEANVEESVDVVRFLLKKGAQPPNGARTDADTPDLAKERGFAWVDMIDAATGTQDAQAKADLLIKKSGYNGVVPGEWVNYAIDNEKVGALKVFLGKGSEYYRPNAHQVDHLHFALDRPKPNMEILKLLLDTSLEDVNKIPKGNSKYAGEAPIHVATRNKSPEAISLLREYGANVDIKGKKKRQTPLLLAVHPDLGKPEMKILEALKGATGTVKDSDGKTPMDYAVEHGDKKIIKWLMQEAGATD